MTDVAADNTAGNPQPDAISWSSYLRATSRAQMQATGERERSGQDLAFRAFDDYQNVRPEVLNTSPGRRNVLAFERCRQALLREINAKRDMRPSADQTRLFDLMRNTMLLKMYGSDPTALMADQEWLKDTLKVEDVNDVLQVEYPRRSGK